MDLKKQYCLAISENRSEPERNTEVKMAENKKDQILTTIHQMFID